jgi:transposase-like protein
MKPRSTEERIQIIEQWEASGLSAHEFSEKIGINVSTLWNWKRARNKKSFSSGRTEQITKPSDGGFIELVPTRKIPEKQRISGEQTEPIELFLRNGSRIVIPPQFDANALRRIVDTLEGR